MGGCGQAGRPCAGLWYGGRKECHLCCFISPSGDSFYFQGITHLEQPLDHFWGRGPGPQASPTVLGMEISGGQAAHTVPCDMRNFGPEGTGDLGPPPWAGVALSTPVSCILEGPLWMSL